MLTDYHTICHLVESFLAITKISVVDLLDYCLKIGLLPPHGVADNQNCDHQLKVALIKLLTDVKLKCISISFMIDYAHYGTGKILTYVDLQQCCIDKTSLHKVLVYIRSITSYLSIEDEIEGVQDVYIKLLLIEALLNVIMFEYNTLSFYHELINVNILQQLVLNEVVKNFVPTEKSINCNEISWRKDYIITRFSVDGLLTDIDLLKRCYGPQLIEGMLIKNDIYRLNTLYNKIINDGKIEISDHIRTIDLPTMKLLQPSNKLKVIDYVQMYGAHDHYSFFDVIWPKAKGVASIKSNILLSRLVRLLLDNTTSTNLKIANISKIAINAIKNLIPINKDWHNSAVCGFAIGILCNPQYELILKIMEEIFDFNIFDALKYVKTIHNNIRFSHAYKGIKFDNKQYVLSQYIDNLFNRRTDWPLDIDAEIYMRMKTPPIHGNFESFVEELVNYDNINYCKYKIILNINEYEQTLMTHLESELQQVINYSVQQRFIPSFKEFFDRRLKWVSGGSAAGFKFEWHDKESDKVNVIRGNKRLAMEQLTEDEIFELFNINLAQETPILHSRSAIKLENGKNRALWNSSVELYIIMGYLCENFDYVLKDAPWYDSGYSLTTKLNVALTKYKDMISNESAYLMFDFADFNIAQTLKVQAALWKYVSEFLAKRANNVEAQKDLIRAGNYCSTAVLNTVMENQNTGLIAFVVRSLMTGSRGTSFVNSIMNKLYGRHISTNVAKMCGIDVDNIIKKHYCTGDDCQFEFVSYKYNMIYLYCMNLYGYAGQTIKILHGCSEFLRVYTDLSGVNYGFLNRLLANFVNGEFKNQLKLNEPDGRLAALDRNMQLYKLRHGNNVVYHNLYKFLIEHITPLRYIRNNKVCTFRPLMLFIKTPVYANGMGILQHNKEVKLLPKLPVAVLHYDKELVHQLCGIASQSAVNKIANYVSPKSLDIIRMDLVNDAIGGYYPDVLLRRVLEDYGQQLSERNLYLNEHVRHCATIKSDEYIDKHVSSRLKQYVLSNDLINQIFTIIDSNININLIYGWLNALIYSSSIPSVLALCKIIEENKFNSVYNGSWRLLIKDVVMKFCPHLSIKLQNDVSLLNVLMYISWNDKFLLNYSLGMTLFDTRPYLFSSTDSFKSIVKLFCLLTIENQMYNVNYTVKQFQIDMYYLITQIYNALNNIVDDDYLLKLNVYRNTF